MNLYRRTDEEEKGEVFYRTIDLFSSILIFSVHIL